MTSPNKVCFVFVSQIQGSIHPHAIIILPNSAGTEVLVCYEDEGVYIDTYGRITKDTVLQWGEMPASVGKFHSCTHNEMTTHTKALNITKMCLYINTRYTVDVELPN